MEIFRPNRRVAQDKGYRGGEADEAFADTLTQVHGCDGAVGGPGEIAAIARFATTLTQRQRHHLGLPLKNGTRNFHKGPGHGVFYQVLTRMNPETLATLLSTWLCRQAGQMPQVLARDGQMIRDPIGRLSLAQHEDGAPQAVAIYDTKEGTTRCEPTVATALLESLPALDGKLITADPLHCQRKRAQTIVQKGGDYLFQIKANQPHRFQTAQALGVRQDTSSKALNCRPNHSRNLPASWTTKQKTLPGGEKLVMVKCYG